MARMDAENLEDRRVNSLYSLDNAEIFKKHFMPKERQRLPRRQATVGFSNPWADHDDGPCGPTTSG